MGDQGIRSNSANRRMILQEREAQSCDARCIWVRTKSHLSKPGRCVAPVQTLPDNLLVKTRSFQ